jgi:hypothetical protein
MRLSEFFNWTWGRHDKRRQCRAVSRRLSLALERLEDRTVPSTLPVLGNLSMITSPLAASPASMAAGTNSSTLGSAASTLSGVSSAAQSLGSDLTKTLQSVITDLTNTIKLVGDMSNSAPSGVTNTLTTDVADLKTLLTDATTTVADVTATLTDLVNALTSGLTSALNGGSITSTLSGVSSSLSNLTTDVTKTLQSVITDLTNTIKLVGDTATTTLTTVTNTLTTAVADLKTLLTDMTTTATDVTATVADVVNVLTSLLTSNLGGLGGTTASTLGGATLAQTQPIGLPLESWQRSEDHLQFQRQPAARSGAAMPSVIREYGQLRLLPSDALFQCHFWRSVCGAGPFQQYPSPVTHNNLGDRLRAAGLPREAGTAYRQAQRQQVGGKGAATSPLRRRRTGTSTARRWRTAS